MIEMILSSRKFREAREADWRRLESLLKRLEAKGPASLTDEELIAVPVLFRAAMSSLSTARETLLDQALLDYLEALCARAYFQVYGVRTSLGDQIFSFLRDTWPRSVRDLRWEICGSVFIFGLGAVIGYLLVRADPEWYFAFVPEVMAQGRDPSAAHEALKKIISHKENIDVLGLFATFLFTHNIQVSLTVFALGFALGAPTLLLTFNNGLPLGAMLEIYTRQGLGIDFVGWLFIHGTTEIFALCIASAAGFRLARALAFPGGATRLAALATAGRTTGAAMIGVLIMLVIAGLLEGIGRQVINDTGARFAIGSVFLVLWLSYFFLTPLRRPGEVRGWRG